MRFLPPRAARRKGGACAAVLFLFLVLGAGAAAADDLAARVVLLANSEDRDSVRVAEHYAEKRGVPRENIVALPMSRAETISWSEFIGTVWEPLLAELVRRDWIEGIGMELTDAIGRKKYAVSGHRIAYLVVCRGVPLRIMHDPQHYVATPPFTNNAQFRTNAGALDAELALLARPNYAINAFVSNPLFRVEQPTALERGQVIKVSRLDGPAVDDALGLVDRALVAERIGLLGRAYVDIGGAHASGDRWLEAVARLVEEMGFDTEVDRARTTFPASARFDAPALYFGWYTGRVGGPFALPGFQFPPGAIALHIHSFSAQSLRTADQHWAGPLVARGATATVGNVFEPYLELTHRPDLLLRALARGEMWGDAMCFALPALSWQAIAIGDPLYRPFAVTFEAQWANRAGLPERLAGYATVRKMDALARGGDEAAAIALGRAEQRARPSFAVGFALAQRLQANGDETGAANALGFVPLLSAYRADEWALAREAAQVLENCGQGAQAVAVYRNLLREKTMPRELRRMWLREAIGVASAARDTAQARAWEDDLARLDAEAAGTKK